jgi:hydrogenase maturation protease HycI
MDATQTSTPSWQSSLDRVLSRLRSLPTGPDGPPRVAVVGIGHELRGDDAAGISVARQLRTRSARWKHVLVVDAGSAPENHTGVLRRFGPRLVLLVDAAFLELPAGTVRWLAWDDAAGVSASTHTLPASVLARYLAAELRCEVALLGIQPATMTIGAALSAPVSRSVARTVVALAQALRL